MPKKTTNARSARIQYALRCKLTKCTNNASNTVQPLPLPHSPVDGNALADNSVDGISLGDYPIDGIPPLSMPVDMIPPVQLLNGGISPVENIVDGIPLTEYPVDGISQVGNQADGIPPVDVEAVYTITETPEGISVTPVAPIGRTKRKYQRRSATKWTSRHEPFMVQYVSPSKNRPVLHTCKSPKNKLDISIKKMRPPLPEGRRLITIGALEKAMNAALQHKTCCTAANLFIKREIRNGLSSRFEIKCTNCNRQSFWIQTDDEHCTLPVNEGGVWGANATGIGYTSMKHSLALLDVPFLCDKTFSRMENKFTERLKTTSEAELKENGKQEAELAISAGQFELVNGTKVPWTHVYADGQWGKRCYNQAGVANSGCACIIGYLTKKPLFVGVRNKFCVICRKHKNSNTEPVPVHQCFKNWSGTSSAMEADIIAEGFNKSLSTHGLVYRKLVGDGDSNVHNQVRLSYHNTDTNYTVVEKIECKNHAIRRMNVSLRALLKQSEYHKSQRRILEERIAAIGKSCAYLIQHNFDNKPATNSVTLRSDLENVLLHVFGEHAACKKYACKDGKSIVPEKFKTRAICADKPLSRNYTPKLNQIRNTPLWAAMMKITNRLATHSQSLIHSMTTNIAESFQSHMNKFLQGRRIDYSARGGYNRKALLATASFQHGAGWYTNTYKRMYAKSPSGYWKRMHTLAQTARNKKTIPRSTRRLFSSLHKDPNTSKTCFHLQSGDQFYGEHAQRVDVPAVELVSGIEKLMQSLAMGSSDEQWQLHLSTVGQWISDAYKFQRRHRITASQSGALFSLKDSTSNASSIDTILQPSFAGNDATSWGKINERKAISCYEHLQNSNVEPSGLFVSLQHGCLAASPDGLIGGDGIIEIKCPYIERFGKPEDVTGRKSNRFLRKTGSSVMLSETCHYYYQVVMQLHVTQRAWCDFVVWTQGPNTEGLVNPMGHIFVQRIFRNDTVEIWTRMENKLVKFWTEDLAPEIVDSRAERSMPYRQPYYREVATKEKKETASRILRYDDTIVSVIAALNPPSV